MIDVLIILGLIYTYILPIFSFIGVNMYLLRFKKKYKIISLVEFILIMGIVIITYAESIYVDNNGLSGGQNHWIYFSIATLIYIIMIFQIYIVVKNKDIV